jgi:ribosomal-protein-alanine N-acetyltransferase
VLTLVTPRLLFAPTPLSVMRERLLRPEFVADVPVDATTTSIASGHLSVSFPEEWPGDDALTMLPIWIARRERLAEPGLWSDGIVVRHEDRLAVGSMGFKARPDATGTVEIGYAVNRSMRGRGFATEMAGAMVAWALRQPEVRRVTAECLTANRASARVLEKLQFLQVGRRASVEGELLVWECRAPAPGGASGETGDAALRPAVELIEPA